MLDETVWWMSYKKCSTHFIILWCDAFIFAILPLRKIYVIFIDYYLIKNSKKNAQIFSNFLVILRLWFLLEKSQLCRNLFQTIESTIVCIHTAHDTYIGFIVHTLCCITVCTVVAVNSATSNCVYSFFEIKQCHAHTPYHACNARWCNLTFVMIRIEIIYREDAIVCLSILLTLTHKHFHFHPLLSSIFTIHT